MATYHVTPSLMVGDVPSDLSTARRVHDRSEALEAIRQGHVAVLPLDGWSLVPLVLEQLGMGKPEIAERISMARIGNQNQSS